MNILRPKTNEEIKTSICQFYNIEAEKREDIDSVFKLHDILPIRNVEDENITIGYVVLVVKQKPTIEYWILGNSSTD